MISIPVRPLPLRILLILALAAGLGALGWFVARAAIGDSVMTYVQRVPNLTTEAQLEGADLAAKFSPEDPQIRWKRGGVYLNAAAEDLEEARLATAVEELRRATRENEHDYRAWLALGRALDRSGASADAGAAFERAIALAPSHFDPRWSMGNHLLRVGDRDGSFRQMRLALTSRPSALPLVFDYAWNAFAGDGKAIAQALDPAVELKPRLIVLLIQRGRAEDAMALWRSLPAPTPDDAQRVAEALVNAGRYATAYQLWTNASLPDRPSADGDSLLANGGFERAFGLNDVTPFHTWRMTPGGLFKLSLDRKDPHEGKQALRSGFSVSENVAFTIASQLVPVKPSTAYRLSFWARAEELESLSPPLVEIYDPALELGIAGRPRNTTRPFEQGTHDWQEYQLDLTTHAATEALKVRIQRLPCAVAPCPIYGRMWFDEFKLVELRPGRAR